HGLFLQVNDGADAVPAPPCPIRRTLAGIDRGGVPFPGQVRAPWRWWGRSALSWRSDERAGRLLATGERRGDLLGQPAPLRAAVPRTVEVPPSVGSRATRAFGRRLFGPAAAGLPGQ